MAEDIAPELLKKIQEAFRENCSTNKDIQEISQKVADGTAGCRDLEAYAIAAGDMLAKAMHDNVSGDILPDGKMYYNIASRILPPNLEECHEMVAEIAEGIYGILNEQAGLHIKALRPDLNRDRIDGLVNYVSNADQYEDVRKSTEQDVVNFSQSVATDAVHKNADFQYKAGLTPKIRREAESGCCKWCQSLEGTYDYGDVRNTGNDVWRRHRDCRCEVTYDPGTGRTQNAHSKTWSWKEENKEKVAERIGVAEDAMKEFNKPTSLNPKLNKAISIEDIEILKNSIRKGDSKIDDEIIDEIYNTLKSNEALNKFDTISIKKLDPKIVFNTNMEASGLWYNAELEINENFFAGKNLELINKIIKLADNTVCENMEDCLKHEIAHANQAISVPVAVVNRYNETPGVKGISKTADRDMLESLAEASVLKEKGIYDTIPGEARERLDKAAKVFDLW